MRARRKRCAAHREAFTHISRRITFGWLRAANAADPADYFSE
jgi:hypothetical protein